MDPSGPTLDQSSLSRGFSSFQKQCIQSKWPRVSGGGLELREFNVLHTTELTLGPVMTNLDARAKSATAVP